MPLLTDFTGMLFDVDMTLTNSQREITAELATQLAKLRESHLKIGTCTGRAFIALKETILPHFPDDSVHVTAGGSQVITNQGEVIWEQLLPENTCQELHELGQKFQQMYYIPTLGAAYGSAPFIQEYQGLHALIPHIHPVEEINTWKVPFMVFVNASPEFYDLLKNRSDVTVKVSRSGQKFTSFDVTPNGITKASGIEQWSKHTGISSEKIIGVGDSDNDLEFLDVVGFAVGMGNCTDEVRARANRIIGQTDDNGLATYLAEILKGSEL